VRFPTRRRQHRPVIENTSKLHPSRVLLAKLCGTCFLTMIRMRSDRVWLWAAGLAFALGASNADAAMISLISVGGAPALGGTATFDLVANFGSDRILGGATDLVWDSTVLHFGAFSFDSSLAPPVRDTSFDVVDNSAA